MTSQTMSCTSTEWAEPSLWKLYIHSIKKQKGAMRFDWVIFFVIIGYAAAKELTSSDPIVQLCFKNAVKCKAECKKTKTRKQCDKVCGAKGFGCMRGMGVIIT
ncbi:hypothetical protein Q1695_006717 [Nippostrongylus brasiliensis]|nr:hypothetical protein Q1695_006717 [Nippostrongylus brasiliensis]